jgi:hypothetical protein
MKILEMFIFRVIFVLISFVAANFVSAAKNFTTFDFHKLGSNNVVLNDKASDACWTNLTESREYAEEKVIMAGSKPQPKSEDRYWGNDYLLVIKVTSNRNKALGLCYGDIEIALITAVEYNGFIHEASLWNYNGPFMGQNNVNREVINAIKAFFVG